MNIRYRVELSEAERGELRAMLSGGKHAARKLKRAQILLAADAGVADETIAISLDVGVSTCLIVANWPSWTTWPLFPCTGRAAMLSGDATLALELMIRISIEV